MKPNPTTARERLNLIACEMPTPAKAPSRLLLVPWGHVKSSSGDFVLDAASVAEIIANFERRGVRVPIDYEHASLGGRFAAPDGRAPAAGWITDLEAVEGHGLFGRVEWTKAGADVVAAKEYRYLSPVVISRSFDDRAVELHSVALTNKPAIERMQAILNSAAAPDTSVQANRDGVIRGAIRQFNRLPEGARVCSREAFVNETLREARLIPLVHSDEGSLVRDDEPRTELVQQLSREWESSPDGREARICCRSKSDFIEGNLLAAGMSKLTDQERRTIG